MDNMSYQDAKKIRAKSFGDIMAKKLAEGQGIGSSFKATLSEKSAAKMKGIKEKFDIMNVAKFMTGGSNLAPALVGRLMGRSSKDIKYFSGIKDKRNDTVTKIDSEGGFAANNQMIESLLEIYQLLKNTDEEKKKEKEKESQFAEEKDLEKERNRDRRHKELMEAITGKPYQTATKVEEEPKGLLESIVDKLGWMKYLLMGPGAGLIALLAGIGISAFLLQKLADNTANMKALSPEEAANALRGSAKDIEKLGGREYLENIVKNGKENAKKLLELPEGEQKDKLILEAGGLDKVKKIAEDTKEYTVPTDIDTGPEKVPPRPDTTGGKNLNRAKSWDAKFGDKYNPDGTKKSATPVPAVVSEQFNKESKEFTERNSVPAPVQTTQAPLVETPTIGQKLNAVQAENLTNKIEEKTAVGKTVVNNAVIKSAMESSFIDGPLLPVRNMEETFQDMILYSTRIV